MSALADDLAHITTPRLKAARILTLDIERLPGLAYAWEPKTRFIPAHQWVRWPSTLCVAAKWHHKREVMFHATWQDGGADAMRQAVWDLFNQADIVVTFNGQRFDNKHLRSDWLEAGMTLPATWKDVDLFVEIRRTLGWESKSLDQACKRLGLDAKSGRYDMHQAEAAANGDVKAQKALERYNKADVRITEALYDRLRQGWLPSHPHMGELDEHGTPTCNQCGSDDLKADGWHPAVVQEYRRYRCGNCGALLRSNLVRRVANTRGIR